MGDPASVTLDTPRLVLREFAEADWPAVYAYRSDPEVARYWEETVSEAQTHAWVREVMAHNRARPRHAYIFAIIRRDDGLLMGQIGTGDPECRHHRDLDLGYALHRSYWGQGYMTEALRALLRFGFEELGARRMCAECDPRNTASARVMEKAGMRQEAHFRAINWAMGAWQDSLLYAILKQDWEASG